MNQSKTMLCEVSECSLYEKDPEHLIQSLVIWQLMLIEWYMKLKSECLCSIWLVLAADFYTCPMLKSNFLVFFPTDSTQ